ncbi:MAG: HAMP domain-containing histidine kinase [Rhodospirillaceae bacterium]|nr:HAMP domain-containing histidine kinase [Rhodospirillaceae bacterium]
MLRSIIDKRPWNPLSITLALMLASLIGCIVTSGLLFVKRERIVQSITQSGSENFTWAFNQLRVEYYRLTMTLDGPRDHDLSELDVDWDKALRKRYEIFVSRVNLVDHGTYRQNMEETSIYQSVLPFLKRVIAETDTRLAATKTFNFPAIAALDTLDDRFAKDLDELAAKAVEADSARLGKMRDDLTSLQVYEVANLAFQLILLIAFGAVAFIGLYRLDRQRRHLVMSAEELKAARIHAEGEAEAKRWALQRALEEEQRTGRLQRRFVSMASHEFRTPLAIIDSSAQRILRKLDSMPREEVIERVDGIRHTVARMGNLIETMLEAGRTEDGKTAFNPALFNLQLHLAKIIKQQRDISPHHRFTEDLRAVPVSFYGDERLMTQILVNLLSNAVKYSPEGGEVHIGSTRAGDAVEISVSDQGVGIPEVEIPNLFEVFFRASTSAGIPGTGLGLDLVRKFVELHNGTIRVSSKVHQGTTFTFALPVRDLSEMESVDAATTSVTAR